MKIGYAFFLVVSSLWMAGVSLGRLDSDKTLHVRVAAYNVEFGKNASPEEIGKMFKPYDLDIIGFNEVPDGDWTARVGKVLGMKHTYVGKISSANHKDKYKSILSRTTLQLTRSSMNSVLSEGVHGTLRRLSKQSLNKWFVCRFLFPTYLPFDRQSKNGPCLPVGQ